MNGLCAALGALGSPAAGESPLRYAIRPGDRIVYERAAVVASLETGAVQQRITDQIQVWCLDQQDQKRLVLLDLIHIVDGTIEPPRGAVLEIDARGLRDMSSATQTRIAEFDAAFDVLPVLRSNVDPQDEWTTPPDPFGRRWRCTLLGPDAQRDGHLKVAFNVADPTGVAGFLGEERFGTFWFDPSERIVSRVESELRHRTAGVTLQAKTKLRRRLSTERSWTLLRADEARQFLRTLENEDRLLRDVLNRPDHIDPTIRHVKRLWSGLTADAAGRDASPVRAVAASQQRRVASVEPSLREAAQRSARWLGRRAHDWSLQAPDGATLRSTELRDRPVVECLWSAESLWGLRALEMMRRLQGALGGRPVRIVCLNMDRDIALARRAIAACGDGLTHVLAESLAAHEEALDFPTVRLLDSDGVVRQVVVGWRPNLYDELRPVLDRLTGGP